MKAFKEKLGPWVLLMCTSIVFDTKFAIQFAAGGLNVVLIAPSKDRLEALIKEMAIQHIAGKYRQRRKLNSFSLGRYLSVSL